MTEGVQTTSVNGSGVGLLVDAVLQGGPADLPAETRAQRVHREERKLKIPHYGGHEHFERDGSALDGSAELVFHWTGRTRVAE
ncbi:MULTISPECIES: DUF5988 family protein [Lentzea]|uniref:Uncharacterized protein n=1 Tax=Lentzea albida TaxID=65499 RepID=A0A1H9V5X1_9PSEU|nr:MULTISPECIES: DUF5988 family protein [Lentzea]USX53698.1 DUF5988 family protein [Lentzea sp. HUAS12]SES17240.1 hypothetical protein SAMN04488000_11756 [Lentzea albida]